MHHCMRWLVECDVEVFALLSCPSDSPALRRFSESARSAANFAVDNVIFVGCAGLDGPVHEVFADVVNYPCDFADLLKLLGVHRGHAVQDILPQAYCQALAVENLVICEIMNALHRAAHKLMSLTVAVDVEV